MVRHGGGVTRIRLDGSGVETDSTGQRNICDVAVDPLLNVFTRDNTNDGDGWDVRLSYVIPGGYYGYPSFYKNFKDEMIQPLADLGGGSPVGALFLSEPNFPAELNNQFYSVEWGRQAIFRHPMEATGAGFKLVGKQEEFMGLPKAIDLDVDGVGHLYAASWVNGGFAYSGGNVGYVVRLTPREHKAATFPDLKKASDEQLLGYLASPTSAVLRQYAQREILKRGGTAFQAGLEKLAASKESLPVRVAALFTLKQLPGGKANEFIVSLTKQEDLRELALRALADQRDDATVPAGPFIEGLTDANPRVRLMAAWGLARLGKADAAGQVLPLVADADPLVSHTAINALVRLKAQTVAMKAVDASTPAVATGALKALQQMHDTQVVDGLVDKLKTVQEPALRTAVLGALCRLNYREADWDGSWWGTRPDSTGPYYKNAEWDGTAKVQETLKAALSSERPEVLRELVVLMQKNKVDFPELMATLKQLAAKDPSFKAVLIDMAANRKELAADQVALLKEVASSAKEPAATRAKALRVLQKQVGKPGVNDALTASLAAIYAEPGADKELTSTFDDVVRDNKLSGQIPYFTKLMTDTDAGRRDVAFLVLANLSNNKLLQKDRRVVAIGKDLDAAWARPEQAASLLRAAGRMKIDAYADRVKAMQKDANPEVAKAANDAAARYGFGKAGTTPAAVATGGALIEKMKYEDVVAAAIADKGDAKLGQEHFTKLGCISCHTVSQKEPPKGPFLGDIFTRYGKPEVCESILKPNAKVTQGFETQWFEDADGETVDGFVTRDAGDEIEIRNPAGVTITLKKSEIKKRGKRELSMMPEGLLAKLTPHDLASILAYLESLKGK
jgi:putative heme-binding domain-containing protein